MSCYGCASKFNFLNKENGCPQCGFSYCNKCLKYKSIVPKLGNTEHMVCKSCYIALGSVKARSAQQEHPAASLQRLASLESPPRAPITVYKHDQRIQHLKAGLTQTDREIADRLEKLREDRKRGPLPSEEEIAKRLALLKGENPLHVQNVDNKPMVPMVPRSQQQQADDLLDQLLEEQRLGLSQTTPVEDITSRLAKLRGDTEPAQVAPRNMEVESEDVGSLEVGNVDSVVAAECSKELEASAKTCLEEVKSVLKKKKEQNNPTMAVLDSDDEGTCEEEVIKKILEEAALEEKLELSDDSGEADTDTEEVPWCVICDRNAIYKCTGCSGDLYCDSCFQEGHTEFDMKDHKTVPYQPSTKK